LVRDVAGLENDTFVLELVGHSDTGQCRTHDFKSELSRLNSEEVCVGAVEGFEELDWYDDVELKRGAYDDLVPGFWGRLKRLFGRNASSYGLEHPP
jgi:hypothetical protein